jgi:hypothetical protein
VSLVEKVKQQAEHAVGLAQQGVTQGQAKFDQMQAKRQSQTLFRRLGEAYYAQQREAGSSEAVTAALAALDEHVAAQAAKDADADVVSADAGGAGAEGGAAETEAASVDSPATNTA